MTNLILMALPDEAPGLKSRTNIFYTGVGKVNAAMTTATLIERYKPTKIINLGTAGGITVGPGLYRVTKFVQRDMLCVPLGCKLGQTPFEDTIILETDADGYTCSTGDSFVTNPELEIPADLVDMESYAIAKVCLKHNVEFICYKFISDNANSSASSDWATMISSGQDSYIDILSKLGI